MHAAPPVRLHARRMGAFLLAASEVSRLPAAPKR